MQSRDLIEEQSFVGEGDVDVGFGVTIAAGLSAADSSDLREIRRRLLGRRRVDLSNVGDLALATVRYRHATGQIAQRIAEDGSPLLAALTQDGRLVSRGSELGLPLGHPLHGGLVDMRTRRAVARYSRVVFEWKEGCSTSLISNRDLLLYSGDPAGLVEAWVRQLIRDSFSGLAKAVFLSGSEADGKAVDGLKLCVSDEVQMVGGIEVQSYPGWQCRTARVQSGGGGIALAVAERIVEHIRLAEVLQEKPDIIVMAQDLWSDFEDRGWTEKTEDGLLYEGIRVVSDPECPADLVYVLNTRYVGLVAHEAQNLGPIGGVRHPADRNAVGLVLGWMGNMVVTSRRLQLVIRIGEYGTDT